MRTPDTVGILSFSESLRSKRSAIEIIFPSVYLSARVRYSA